MSNIRYKTTGQLIDELITVSFKQEINDSDALRTKAKLLGREIAKTLAQNVEAAEKILQLKSQLAVVSRNCWDAQEQVMSLDLDENTHELAQNAKLAQEYNAGRNQYIRLIDSILRETNTVTEKTYE